MTTETLLPPPSIDADTLAPLLDDRERACEVRKLTGFRCRNAADWVVSGCCDHCGPATGLVCDECLPDLLSSWRWSRHGDGGKVTVIRTEAVR